MTGHTETDTEFADGTSPLCVPIDGELTNPSDDTLSVLGIERRVDYKVAT